MTHLTRDELVDSAEGTLDEGRMAHLRSCDACREQAEWMGTMLARVAEVEVPEPSPLFWDHLSRRVADAVATPAPRGTRWLGWLTRPASAWAVGLASLALLAAVSFSGRPAMAPTPPTPVSSVEQQVDAVPSETEDIDGDEAWALVRTVADEVGWDEAHAAGLSARPGSVERMALELTSREQSELALLIQAELKRPGA